MSKSHPAHLLHELVLSDHDFQVFHRTLGTLQNPPTEKLVHHTQKNTAYPWVVSNLNLFLCALI